MSARRPSRASTTGASRTATSGACASRSRRSGAPTSCSGRRRWAASARPASPPGSARSRSRWCAARPSRAPPSPSPARPPRSRNYPSRLAERRRPATRHGLPPESPLLGYDHGSGVLDLPAPPPEPAPAVDLRELRELVPPAEPGREVDDWGRSQRVFDLVEPLLDFYYRHWFRVEVEGVENVPAEGGALIVSNHSGALPPDAPMIMQAIRHEHPSPRPLYMLGENWFKGYPGVGLLANKIGLVGAHPANAQRLLGDEGKLVLVFPEGQKGSRKLYWQRYRLRRFRPG